jgi:hypothetical protein
MRILMVHPLSGPDFSVHDVLVGWLEAFRELGVDAEVFNLGNTNDRFITHSSLLMDARERDETGHPLVKQAFTREQAIQLSLEGLYGALYCYGPDVVMFVSAFFTQPETFRLIRAHGHKVVILHTESPYLPG